MSLAVRISVSHVVLGQAKPAREEFHSCGKQSLGLGRWSVGKVLAEQAQRPKFGSPESM